MKITHATIFLFITLASCEVPPPYLRRGFRPSPQLLDTSSTSKFPQTQYGPPRQLSNVVDIEIPSRLTIEQLIRLTEQLQSSQKKQIKRPQTIQLQAPLNSYQLPVRQPQTVYGSPSKYEVSHIQLRPPPFANAGTSLPQNTYGAPQVSQQTFRPVNRPLNQYTSFQNSQNILQSTYGASNVQQLPKNSHSSHFGVSGGQYNLQIPPATKYGIPDTRGIETFGGLHNAPQTDTEILKQNLLEDLKKQHLPYKEPTGFRPQESQNNEGQNVPQYLPSNAGNNLPEQRPQNAAHPSFTPGTAQNIPQQVLGPNQQYLPSNNGDGNGQFPKSGLGTGQLINKPNIGPQNSLGGVNSLYQTPQNTDSPLNAGGSVNNVGLMYLPPQTTPRAVITTQETTVRSPPIGTTTKSPERTINYDYDYDQQQPTEAPSNQDGSVTDPNVAISTAVAGGSGFFYLQQPDGRLQRVVLQKTQEPSSKPEEYVANYYFQNVQAVPNAAYAPLISLGAWK